MRFNLVEFSVYSQWGEDGIVQHLLRYVPISNKMFVEFGVENYLEANTRFLMIKDNWTGLVMDGSNENIDYIRQDDIFWRFHLKAQQAFITRENINVIFYSLMGLTATSDCYRSMSTETTIGWKRSMP